MDFFKKFYNKSFSDFVNILLYKLTGGRVDFRYSSAVGKYREKLSIKVANMMNYKVHYGIFKGFRLSKDVFWGEKDLGSKVLGLYELEIQQLLSSIQKKKKKSMLVDVGGADGFYAVGSLVNNTFDQCICFELTKQGRASIKRTAYDNSVTDRLKIFGEANVNSFLSVLSSDVDLLDCVILIDIEGGEYDLLTDKVLNELKQTEVIIEIHVFNEQQELERIKLMKVVSNLFNLNIIRTSGRDFSEIDKAYQFTDTDRGLFISESRDRLGEWWHLSAKK